MRGTKYRLYVDETGNASYPKGSPDAVGKRYLALTGIAISENTYANVLCPKIDNLKHLLTNDYDERFTLHRDEIKERSGYYAALKDPKVEAAWNTLMQDMIEKTDYTVFSVVIDKVEHRDKYPRPNHPYYYCLEVIIERYLKFLELNGGYGDILFESRGKSEDNELRRQYRRIYEYGNYYMSPKTIQQYLTSKDIKLKDKTRMIAGLELADLLALATKLDTLMLYGRINAIASTFMQDLLRWVEPKYYFEGKKGHGRKLLI